MSAVIKITLKFYGPETWYEVTYLFRDPWSLNNLEQPCIISQLNLYLHTLPTHLLQFWPACVQVLSLRNPTMTSCLSEGQSFQACSISSL